jgi:hypothetical protein
MRNNKPHKQQKTTQGGVYTHTSREAAAVTAAAADKGDDCYIHKYRVLGAATATTQELTAVGKSCQIVAVVAVYCVHWRREEED